jgi:peroxiredoxin
MVVKKGAIMKKGDRAPQLTLLNENNEQVEIASLWQDQPLALYFTRHMG